MKNMRFKVGDRVKIKSLNWYNEKKDEYGNVKCSLNCSLTKAMSIHCGSIQTIESVVDGGIYWMKENLFNWTDEMIEGLVEDDNNHLLTETVVDTVRESNDRYRIVIDPRFDIEVDEGEYYAVRRKKEYPKTYEECCEILDILGNINIEGYKKELLLSLQKLLICRDAYWKIAGEEMGLGKPWEPSKDKMVYSIYRHSNEIETDFFSGESVTFEFPTAEMQAAFKENFDPYIEICKELL